MLLTVTDISGEKRERAVDNQGASLGAMLGSHRSAVDACTYNGRLLVQWEQIVPVKGDRVELYVKTGGPVIGLIFGFVINLAISAIIRALTPQPKKPRTNQRREEAFGIAGFQNTTGAGIPGFVVYGQNTVYGHVIGSGETVSEDGKDMLGKVLYFMGDAGGDGYESIENIKIDGAGIDQYPEITTYTRLGTDSQSVIPEFENADFLAYDGTTLQWDDETGGTEHVYTTSSDTVERATLVFDFVSGLYRISSTGGTKQNKTIIKIETKLNSDPVGSYAEVSGSPVTYKGRRRSEMFKTFQIDFGSKNKWDIRITRTYGHDGGPNSTHVDTVTLFNVQETEFTTRNYGGNALLALVGIPAKKIRSLETMRVSALVKGKKVKIPDGLGGYTTEFTRQRAWIVRDMATHDRVGMYGEIDESEIDDDQWLTEQAYHDELVTAQGGGTEVRDCCDVITNESRWDWEWIKDVAAEGRARLIPVGDMWQYRIDRPGTPNLLYVSPGNIIEDSLVAEIGPPDRQFNQIIAQYRDEENDHAPDISPPITDGSPSVIIQEAVKYETLTRESEVLRENMVQLKRSALERRRWTWTSSLNALPSIPLDIDWFGEKQQGENTYTGRLPAQVVGQPTRVILPDLVEIQGGKTYSIIVQHMLDNTVQERVVSTGVGNWFAVEVTQAFTVQPQEHDVFSFGEQNVDHIQTRLLETTLDDAGRIRQVRAEYLPSIYTPDALPPRLSRRWFKLRTLLQPIPLKDATVAEEVALNKDGSQRSILWFDVTPGVIRHGGKAQGGGSTTIQLASDEPDRDDYYNTATVRIVAGTGSGQERVITDYTGSTTTATVDTWTTTPDSTSEYEIEWQKFGTFSGFKVEISDDGTNWSEVGKTLGIHLEIDGREQTGTYYFRFTPFTENEVENLLARITQSLTLQGDQSAPTAPAAVSITSYLKNAAVNVGLTRPVAEDLAGVEVELWRTAITSGTLIATKRFAAPADTASSGTLSIECAFNLDSESYGNEIWARARTVDTSDNQSGNTDSSSGATLSEVVTVDVTDNAITNDGASSNDAATSDISNTETIVDTLTVSTDGGVGVVLYKGHWTYEATGSPTWTKVRIRKDNVTGTVLDMIQNTAPVGAPAENDIALIGTDSSPASSQTYVVTLEFESTSMNYNNLSYRRLVALNLKK